MSRRSTPERIHAARRASVVSRLVQERRLSQQRAEALVAAWEVEGDLLDRWRCVKSFGPMLVTGC